MLVVFDDLGSCGVCNDNIIWAAFIIWQVIGKFFFSYVCEEGYLTNGIIFFDIRSILRKNSIQFPSVLHAREREIHQYSMIKLIKQFIFELTPVLYYQAYVTHIKRLITHWILTSRIRVRS